MLVNKQNSHIISEDEEKQYLLVAPQPLHDIAVIMLDTGMGSTEIYMLERKNVVISKKVSGSQNDDFVLIDGKEGKTRKFHLTKRVSALLQSRTERFSGAYLFPNKDDENAAQLPRTTDADSKRFKSKYNHFLSNQHKRTSLKSGTSFRLYDCRLTFIRRASELNISSEEIWRVLGDIATTIGKEYK